MEKGLGEETEKLMIEIENYFCLSDRTGNIFFPGIEVKSKTDYDQPYSLYNKQSYRYVETP